MEHREIEDIETETNLVDAKPARQKKVEYKSLYAIKKSFFDKNRRVINKNIILTWDYDKNGEIVFSVGEIVDAEHGIYVIFNTNAVILTEPFKGYDLKTQKYYEDIPRNDKIVYSKMGYMPDENGECYRSFSYIYSITENLFSLNENKDVKDSHLLYFGDFGKTKPKFKFSYHDKNHLFCGGVKPLSMWLDFEKDINKIYKRYMHLGQNYLQEDEELILKEHQKTKEEHEKSIKKFYKEITGKDTEPEGTIIDSMFK